MKNKFFSFLIFSIILSNSFINAQESNYNPEKTQKQRPSVAVVLAGGGARGFAHIPVLQMLQDENIPVDIIIGTSSGSIVGGLYCAGYSPNIIAEKLTNLNWGYLFQDNVTSPFEKNLENHSYYSTPFALKLASQNNNITLQMGSSLLTGQRAYELLKRLTIRIPSNTDFDTLPIPFRAVSVDLLTGELLVLDNGDIAEAMRCSMSIPGLFQPFLLDGRYCVDGMAQDNNPIDVAHELGYDIIIDVDFGSTLETDYNAFKTNPLIAVTQMLNIPTNSKNFENYKYADIVILPDFGGHSLIDYDSATEIYNLAKADIERYRPQIKQIKKKIETWSQENNKTTDSCENKSLSNIASNLQFDSKTALLRQKPCLFAKKYFDNPLPSPTSLYIETNSTSTKTYATKYFFNTVKNNENFSPETLSTLSEGIYNTGKYDTVTTRINKNDNKEELLINTIEKKTENSTILFGVNSDGTLSADSFSEFNLSADFQIRGLTGEGSVLSLKGVVLGDFAAELMYMQPIGSHLFIEFDSSYLYDHLNTGSGWDNTIETHNLLIKKAYFSTTLGITLSTNSTLTGGGKIAWYDTTNEITTDISSIASDFNVHYVFNNLDHTLFPESGNFLSLKHTAVLPITEANNVSIFGVSQINAVTAIPLKKNTSLVLGGFIGSNIDQRLSNKTDLSPIYGFSIADRQFLPQISNRSDYGLHKFALRTAIQVAPWDQITLLGGKAFFSISGAVGNIFNSFDTMTLKGLEWRSSLDASLRITDGFGILLRLGAGTIQDTVLPFISLDIGNITL